MTWLLYGANGYTGALVAEEAARRGERPVLAGRREEAIRPLAERLGLAWRTFALDDPARIAEELRAAGARAVLLCAGPFSATSAPVVEACLRAGAHYLDITGEIAVLEACHARDAEARRAGVVVMPGVGFDVVPSDCLAASLKEALPDATHLELAFAATGAPSAGTTKTAVEGAGKGGAIRRDGRIVRVPHAWRTATVPFPGGSRLAVTIPWGDVSTAWYSTRIPNIEVYLAAPPRMIRGMKLLRLAAPIVALGPVERLIKRRVERTVTGPDEATRRAGRVELWGRVTNAAGRRVEGTLVTPEGYHLTMLTALECTRRVVAGGVGAGALTPSMAFGARFITEFERCELRVG